MRSDQNDSLKKHAALSRKRFRLRNRVVTIMMRLEEMFMKKKMIARMLTAVFVLWCMSLIMAGLVLAAEPDTLFDEWNEDVPALNTLVDYVESVTDEGSECYIPEEDRIAVFDMDGTLIGELFPIYLETVVVTNRILADPSWEPDAEMLEYGRIMRDHALDRSFPPGYYYTFSSHKARAFAGMTLDEYAGFVRKLLALDADGFEGMTYANAFYLPMAEVVEYLSDNGFNCYVVSGSDRFIVRTIMEDVIDIPSDHIIGSDIELAASGQGDTKAIDYEFTGNDTIMLTEKQFFENIKASKVLQIVREIGKQPVLSFGNSSGDISMSNYVLHNNRYDSKAFMLVADDDMRDYGNLEKGKELRRKWEDMGYTVISMRDDWKTIYGKDVKKTGEFHWLDDYSDDRIPLRNAETELETGENRLLAYR